MDPPPTLSPVAPRVRHRFALQFSLPRHRRFEGPSSPPLELATSSATPSPSHPSLAQTRGGSTSPIASPDTPPSAYMPSTATWAPLMPVTSLLLTRLATPSSHNVLKLETTPTPKIEVSRVELGPTLLWEEGKRESKSVMNNMLGSILLPTEGKEEAKSVMNNRLPPTSSRKAAPSRLPILPPITSPSWIDIGPWFAHLPLTDKCHAALGLMWQDFFRMVIRLYNIRNACFVDRMFVGLLERTDSEAIKAYDKVIPWWSEHPDTIVAFSPSGRIVEGCPSSECVGQPFAFMEATHLDSRDTIACRDQPMRLVTLSLGSPRFGESHANMIIINDERREYERFEPHGDKTERFTASDEKLNRLLNAAMQSKYAQSTLGIPTDYKYLTPMDFCPALGPQSLSRAEFEAERKRCPRGGFCLTWSIMYGLIRIVNSRLSREQAVEATMLPVVKGESRHDTIRRFQSFIDYILNFNSPPPRPRSRWHKF